MTIQAKATSFAGAVVFDLPYMQLVDYRSQRPVADSILIEAVPVDDKPEEPTETVSNELFNKLTSRERVVVQGVVDGLPDKEIAVKIGKSWETVRVQVHSVLRKLELKNRTQVACAAISYGGYRTHMPLVASATRCAQVLNKLTTAERDVVQTIVDGLTVREAARKLRRSNRTLYELVNSVMAKLELENRTQVLFAAILYGGYRTHMLPPANQAPQIRRAEVFRNLPPSERLVVQGVVDGQSDMQIAMESGKSEGTIHSQVKSVLRKLRVTSRTEIAIVALTYGGYKTHLSAFVVPQ